MKLCMHCVCVFTKKFVEISPVNIVTIKTVEFQEPKKRERMATSFTLKKINGFTFVILKIDFLKEKQYNFSQGPPPPRQEVDLKTGQRRHNKVSLRQCCLYSNLIGCSIITLQCATRKEHYKYLHHPRLPPRARVLRS